MLFDLFPAEYGTIATGRVGTCIVHGVGTACCRTFADVSMGTHGHEHEFVVEIVLPHKHLGFRTICCQTDIACKTIAGTEDVAAIGTL